MDPQHILESFLKGAEPTLLLVGAGISRGSIPTVEDFHGEIARALGEPFPSPRLGKLSAIPRDRVERAYLDAATSDLPFEFIVGLLSSIGILRPSVIPSLFTSDSPDAYHRLIAILARRPNFRIATTNFDEMLEKAAPELSVWLPGQPSSHASRAKLWKLHGTVSQPLSLRVSIPTVCTNRENFTPLSDTLGDATNLIVLGYSASDVFDVVPWLFSRVWQRILWFEYKEAEAHAILIRAGSPSQRLTREPECLIRERSRCGGFIIEGNPQPLLREVLVVLHGGLENQKETGQRRSSHLEDMFTVEPPIAVLAFLDSIGCERFWEPYLDRLVEGHEERGCLATIDFDLDPLSRVYATMLLADRHRPYFLECEREFLNPDYKGPANQPAALQSVLAHSRLRALFRNDAKSDAFIRAKLFQEDVCLYEVLWHGNHRRYNFEKLGWDRSNILKLLQEIEDCLRGASRELPAIRARASVGDEAAMLEYQIWTIYTARYLVIQGYCGHMYVYGASQPSFAILQLLRALRMTLRTGDVTTEARVCESLSRLLERFPAAVTDECQKEVAELIASVKQVNPALSVASDSRSLALYCCERALELFSTGIEGWLRAPNAPGRVETLLPHYRSILLSCNLEQNELGRYVAHESRPFYHRCRLRCGLTASLAAE